MIGARALLETHLASGVDTCFMNPGLGNGLANLHNARRARTPVVNIVGDHATYHQAYDALLQSDISWSEGDGPAAPTDRSNDLPVDEAVVGEAAKALRSGERPGFLVGGDGTRRQALMVLGDVAQRFGAETIVETFPARLERGAGIPTLTALPYLGEKAAELLDSLAHLILVGARSPVSFYPGKPSDLVPGGCQVHQLSEPGQPGAGSLEALAAELDVAPGTWRAPDAERPRPPSGADALTAEAVNRAVGALMPEESIVSDESATSGFGARGASSGAPPHDWLTLTGGAIGQGLPVAVGAAVASPGRRVIALQADGGSLYTIQALWTMAREGLDVTTVIFNNRSYGILNMELDRVGAAAGGPRARAMLALSRPDLDFVSLAAGLGVAATRANTAGEFSDHLAAALGYARPNPDRGRDLRGRDLRGRDLRSEARAPGGQVCYPGPCDTDGVCLCTVYTSHLPRSGSAIRSSCTRAPAAPRA